MLISTSFLKSSYDNFKKKRGKAERAKEGFSAWQSSSAGISASFEAFVLVVAILFFILELLLLFYAISLAMICTRPGPSRIINITLALTFTTPFILLQILLNKCAQTTLDNSSIFMTPLSGRNSYGGPGAGPSGLSFL